VRVSVCVCVRAPLVVRWETGAAGRAQGTVKDEFFLAHVLGWWAKAIMLRDPALSWFCSIMCARCAPRTQSDVVFLVPPRVGGRNHRLAGRMLLKHTHTHTHNTQLLLPLDEICAAQV
jgi:hypothetical protein